MTTNNLTAVLHAIDNIRLEERPMPVPKEGEVLLKMGCVGICGSDVHYWKAGRIGKFILEAPMVMGHEASGTVAALGPGVTNLAVGDRVAIEPGVPCRLCTKCKAGAYHLCPDMRFCATPPIHGNLARYYTHAADFCYKLPKHVSLEEGALLEPLSVGVHACKKAGVTLGSHVLVLGAGPIGLVTAISAKAMSASSIVVADVVEQRVERAKKLGVLGLVLGKDESAAAAAERVRKLMGTSPDISVDCVGIQSTARLAIEATSEGGKVVLVGMGSLEVSVPLVEASIKELTLLGSFRYCNDYPMALEMVAQGKAEVGQLVTHRFRLEDTVEAFETAASGKGNPLKIIINC